MKRLAYIVLALVAVSFFSCNKVEEPRNTNSNDNCITTFTASMPESPLTKTTMSRPSILWADGDKIRIIGYTEGQTVQQAIFKIKSGQGTKNAVFEIDEGETMGTHTQYFAFYPSTIAIKTASLPTSLEVNTGLTVNAQNAVEGGFDPSLGIMTAKADADGKLAFTHGVAYLGVQIPDDNSTALKITFGKNAAQKRPVYSTDDGSITANNSGTAEIKATGTFVKGSYYYLCAIPNTANKMTSVTVTYTHNGVDKSITSTTMANDKLEIGKLYDFGCPPVPVLDPVINASNVSIAADDEGGTITYTVANEVSGGVVSAAIQDAGTIAGLVLGTPSAGSLTFTCAANTEATAKTATVRLTYTYNTSETVTKDVVITQASNGGSATPETHVRVYYNGNTECLDGTAVTSSPYYFSHSTSYVALNSSASNGGGIDTFDIPGTTFTATSSLKLDGSGNLSFTTSSTLNSSVTFYYTKRASGTGKIQITPEGGSATVYTDAAYGTVSSQTVSLEKNKQYTINRNSGELLLLGVVVNETSE